MTNFTIQNLKKMLLCCCLLGSMTTLNAQSFEWAKGVISNTQSTIVKASAVDASGNVYLTGGFSGGSADFDPGPGVQTLTTDGYDIFVLKLNAAGGFVWVKQFVGAHSLGGGEPTDINVDASGNIFISGYFGSFDGNPYAMDFDPGINVYNLTNSSVDYTYDGFVVKLNTNGDLEWANKIGANGDEMCSALDVDNSGNILVTGYFGGTVDFNPGPATDDLTATDKDMFIAKFNNDGDYVWAKSIDGEAAYGVIPKSIKSDADGNVFTMGTYGGVIDFDPGAGIQNLSTGISSQGWVVQNVFISKLDANGAYVWAKNMGDPMGTVSNFIQPMTMAVDIDGNVYASGGYADTTDFDPSADTAYLYANGNDDIFIAKIDANGSLIWVKSMGGFGLEIAWDMETDNLGNAYTIGLFQSPVDFDPSDTGDYTITPATQYGGVFLHKVDALGNFSWVTHIDNVPNGNLGGNGMSLAIDPSDHSLYVASNFSDTIDFDPGSDAVYLEGLDADFFAAKFKNCNLLTSTINTTACDSFTLNDTTYSESGTYNQTYVAANGCDSILTLQLIINHIPDAAVTQTDNMLTANTAGATYQWLDCNSGHSAIAGAVQQTFTATTDGSYAVVVSKDGCSDTSTCYMITGLGIDKKEASNFVSVYPNPVTGILTITTSKQLHYAHIRLINILGQSMTGQSHVSGNNFKLDMSPYAAGTYILEIEADGEISRTKIVKK